MVVMRKAALPRERGLRTYGIGKKGFSGSVPWPLVHLAGQTGTCQEAFLQASDNRLPQFVPSGPIQRGEGNHRNSRFQTELGLQGLAIALQGGTGQFIAFGQYDQVGNLTVPEPFQKLNIEREASWRQSTREQTRRRFGRWAMYESISEDHSLRISPLTLA